MIEFFYESELNFELPKNLKFWLESCISDFEKKTGTINFVFCDDAYLLNINKTYLQHDNYTDIITFDYVKANIISGDIFISFDRVLDNCKLSNTFNEELLRICIHGVLHLLGFNDKSVEDKSIMTGKENYYLDIYKQKFLN